MKRYLEAGPTTSYTPILYNKARVNIMLDAFKYLPMLYNYHTKGRSEEVLEDHKSIYGFMENPHQMPGGAHFGMFVKYIELMGTEEHKKLYFDKAARC